MTKTIRSLILILVLALTMPACSGGDQPTPSPVVIYVPVTVTPEAAQALPTDTQQPLPTNPPPTDTSVPVTATSELLHFYVSGVVWKDICKRVNPIPNPLPAGCVLNSTGGLAGNGIYDSGEPGIAGITVRLEIDCNYGAFTTVTDANGNYSMSFTVPKSAGVAQQKICISVDTAEGNNTSILIPGGWTSPATNTGKALIQMTIPVEQQNTINFGWDYQFQ